MGLGLGVVAGLGILAEGCIYKTLLPDVFTNANPRSCRFRLQPVRLDGIVIWGLALRSENISPIHIEAGLRQTVRSQAVRSQ